MPRLPSGLLVLSDRHLFRSRVSSRHVLPRQDRDSKPLPHRYLQSSLGSLNAHPVLLVPRGLLLRLDWLGSTHRPMRCRLLLQVGSHNSNSRSGTEERPLQPWLLLSSGNSYPDPLPGWHLQRHCSEYWHCSMPLLPCGSLLQLEG